MHVLAITIPPLRDRLGDLPLLTAAWQERRGLQMDIPLNVRLAMERYPWPGNIRELYNFLDRYAAFGDAALDSLGDAARSSLSLLPPELEEGVTLEELLDNCLEEGDQEGFHALFEEYLEKIRVHQEMEVSDYDLVFGNILIDAEGRWNLIDYEWTFEERVDMEALAYRSLYCYQMGDGSRKGLSMEPFLRRLGISEEKAEEYRARERRFQKAVTGNRVSISDMRVLLGRRAVPWQSFFSQVERSVVEVFEDFGRGYSPEHSYHLYPSYIAADMMRLSILLKEGVRGVRVDPAECSCIIRMKAARLAGKELDLADKAVLAMNGWELSGKGEKMPVFFFHTNDPNINIRLEKEDGEAGEMLELEFEISRLPEETAAALDSNLKRRHWF